MFDFIIFVVVDIINDIWVFILICLIVFDDFFFYILCSVCLFFF